MQFQSIKQSPPEPGQLILVTDGDNAEAVIYTPETFKKPKALDKYDTPNFTINDYGLQWAPLELPNLEIACTYTAEDKFPLSGKYAHHYFRDIPSGYFLWLKQQAWFLQNRSPKYLGVLNYIKTIEEDAQVEKGIEIGKMRRI